MLRVSEENNKWVDAMVEEVIRKLDQFSVDLVEPRINAYITHESSSKAIPDFFSHKLTIRKGETS